jgi:3'-phosphoadenosine 5'-phosphosulfate sulfotransferase (PAPS reductase)/FAD synthetase
MFEDINQRIEAAIEVMVSLIKQQYVFSCAVGGGKDSTVALIITLEAIRRVAREGFHQGEHYVISANTAIENSSMRGPRRANADGDRRPRGRERATRERPHCDADSRQPVRGGHARSRHAHTHTGKQCARWEEEAPMLGLWKVEPQERLRSSLEREASTSGVREIITVLGTRFSESASRGSAMTERGENAIRPVRNAAGTLTLSPICDFDLEDVWTVAALFTNDVSPFPSPVSKRTIERMTDLYRAGNEGTCGVVVGEGGNRAACGSRFGCAFCCISGEKDRSMESMIREREHAYMEGLNRFRNYLLRTQWDLGRRELVGRKLSDAGYLRVKPDVLSYHERVTLLKYLLTLDALE